jgi:threonine/homoserine/homoserine lactone efflux protein
VPELTSEVTILVIFSTSFIVGLSGALMPGPLLTLTISEVARHGFWAGPLLVLGHGLLELSLVIALIFGLNRILDNETVAGVIGMVGGVVLIYMGLSTLQEGWNRVAMPSMSDMSADLKRKSVLSGMLVSIANPYWVIWWATIGMYYLLWSLKLFTGHILSDLVWYTLVSYIVWRGKRIISNTVYRWLLLICGLALVGLGIFFIVTGIKTLM